MNIKFVIKLIKPYIKNKQLKEKDFEKVFSFLDLHEKYSVINILIENDIEIIYEDELTVSEDSEENQENYNLTQNKFLKKDINISNEQLCLMYQNGDKKALDLLYMKNKAFIWKKAKKLSKWYNHKLDEEDLVAYGFFGFKKAADRFDNSLDNKFLTYADFWIKQSITRAIADYGFTIRIPVHMFENINYIRRIIRDKAFDNRESLIEFISKEREVEKSQVTNWMNIAENILVPASLNIKVGDGNDTELMELLDIQYFSVEEEVLDNIFREDILKFTENLKPRQIEIIRKRFGFDGEPQTLEEIGDQFNLTRERIRQIEAKALRKMRKMKDFKCMHCYLED